MVTLYSPSCSRDSILHLSTHERMKIEWDCNYMNWEIVIWFLNLLQGHDSIILGVGVLNCYCFGVLHSYYVWFLCSLSVNCAFDVNQIGSFHLLQRWDGPRLIGVPSLVAQPVLMKLKNCIFNAILLKVIWLCIWIKHTANNNSQAKLWVQYEAYELEFTVAYMHSRLFKLQLYCIWTSAVKKTKDFLWVNIKQHECNGIFIKGSL